MALPGMPLMPLYLQQVFLSLHQKDSLYIWQAPLQVSSHFKQHHQLEMPLTPEPVGETGFIQTGMTQYSYT